MSKQLNDEMRSKLVNLTAMERKYFSVMWAKYGVLNITSKPGIAKSAIGKSIAKKMGFRYEDVRLTMIDETDVGLFPNVSEIEDGEGNMIKCLDFVVPRWAIEANKKPTIIHFEELNRASSQVRNAALQILLEREIGGSFKFNDNVLMMSSGNLGDEDGADVEEFDSALNNRLIHIDHVLSVKDWIDGYAEENVHKTITSFIKTYPEYMYRGAGDNAKAYATPRSWTMLSEFITANFGENASPSEFLGDLKTVALGYIGNSAMKFIKYCEDMLNISLKDVLNNYDGIKEELSKYNRDKSSELIQSLKEIDITSLTNKQISNVVNFLKGVGEDERTGYLLNLLDTIDDVDDDKLTNFLLEFQDLLITIQDINGVDNSKK